MILERLGADTECVTRFGIGHVVASLGFQALVGSIALGHGPWPRWKSHYCETGPGHGRAIGLVEYLLAGDVLTGCGPSYQRLQLFLGQPAA